MAGLSEILEEAIFNDVLGGHCLDPFNCIFRGGIYPIACPRGN